MFKPTNADDETTNTLYMEKISKVEKVAARVIRFLSSALLTLFSFMFGATSIAAVATAIIDRDFMGVIGCGACAFLAWVCWSVRRDV